MISTLIDKQDNVELVRDQIATILINEINEQQVLAVAGGKDPQYWDLNIYTQRFNPFEQWLNDSNPSIPITPIVNVAFDSLVNDRSSSDEIKRQKADAIYNIDMYGLGAAQDLVGDGFIPADQNAFAESQRATRLVRNILMAGIYTYLDLPGLVWGRWVDSIVSFLPEINGRQLQRIVGTRIKFNVSFNEFSPQYEPAILNSVLVTAKEVETDETLLQAEYDYT